MNIAGGIALSLKQGKHGEKIENSPPMAKNEPAAECGVGSEQAAQPEVADLVTLIEAERSAREQMDAQYLRLMADFDNFRRRSRTELAQAGDAAQEALIQKLLPVIDNFDRALVSTGGSVEAFASGIEMIYRQLVETLREAGLEPVGAAGRPFDPGCHQAVMRVGDADDGGELVVLQELRKGYALKGRVIRPSLVQVGPGAACAPGADEAMEGEKNE